jgi:regulator of replication initiation timing
MPENLTRRGGEEVETEILGLVAHRMNLSNSWHHTSIESVREFLLQQDIQAKKAALTKTGEQADYISLLEQGLAEKEKEILNIKNDAGFWESEFSQLETENSRLRYENESIKARLASAGLERRESDAEESATDSLRKAIFRAVAGQPSVKDSLQIVKAIFSERIVVLPSAIKSSKDSAAFQEGQKAFRLMWTLATDYWAAMSEGKGDVEARKCFGANSYSAKESETVEKNSRARKLRTFDYKGKPIEMMRHLKIGVKASDAETFRLHFEWVADERVLVIGHCGPHLDHG